MSIYYGTSFSPGYNPWCPGQSTEVTRTKTMRNKNKKFKKKERDLTPTVVEITYRERDPETLTYKEVRKTRKTYHTDGTVTFEEFEIK